MTSYKKILNNSNIFLSLVCRHEIARFAKIIATSNGNYSILALSLEQATMLTIASELISASGNPLFEDLLLECQPIVLWYQFYLIQSIALLPYIETSDI